METSNTIFPKSLIFCGLAERSYFALRKLKNHIELNNKDKDAINDAVSFLKNAINGRKVIEDLELGENALLDSYSFREAFNATLCAFRASYENGGIELILQFFNKLIKHLNLIIEKKDIKDEDLDDLILFFSEVRDHTLRLHVGSFDSFVTGSDLYVSNSR